MKLKITTIRVEIVIRFDALDAPLTESEAEETNLTFTVALLGVRQSPAIGKKRDVTFCLLRARS